MARGLRGRWWQEGGKLLAQELKRVRRQEGPEALLKLFEDEEELPPHACPFHGQLSSENSTVVSLPAEWSGTLACMPCGRLLQHALCGACGALGIGWHGLHGLGLSRLACKSCQAKPCVRKALHVLLDCIGSHSVARGMHQEQELLRLRCSRC